jgi:hypothetical protein
MQSADVTHIPRLFTIPEAQLLAEVDEVMVVVVLVVVRAMCICVRSMGAQAVLFVSFYFVPFSGQAINIILERIG